MEREKIDGITSIECKFHGNYVECIINEIEGDKPKKIKTEQLLAKGVVSNIIFGEMHFSGLELDVVSENRDYFGCLKATFKEEVVPCAGKVNVLIIEPSTKSYCIDYVKNEICLVEED